MVWILKISVSRHLAGTRNWKMKHLNSVILWRSFQKDLCKWNQGPIYWIGTSNAEKGYLPNRTWSCPLPQKSGAVWFWPSEQQFVMMLQIIFPGETTFCLTSKGIKEKRIAFLPLILPHKIPTKKEICTLGILNFFSSFFSLRRSLNVDYPRNKCNYELLT